MAVSVKELWRARSLLTFPNNQHRHKSKLTLSKEVSTFPASAMQLDFRYKLTNLDQSSCSSHRSDGFSKILIRVAHILLRHTQTTRVLAGLQEGIQEREREVYIDYSPHTLLEWRS